MSMLDGLRHRVYVLWRGERYGREVERELHFHVELERLAASHDHSATDAELAARRAMGNTTYYREEVRRMTPLAWLDVLRKDVAYAWRGRRRSPGFTASAGARARRTPHPAEARPAKRAESCGAPPRG